MLRNLCLALLLLSPGASQALPLISEAFYDASGSDDGLVFVELFGTPGTSLDGLVLKFDFQNGPDSFVRRDSTDCPPMAKDVHARPVTRRAGFR